MLASRVAEGRSSRGEGDTPSEVEELSRPTARLGDLRMQGSSSLCALLRLVHVTSPDKGALFWGFLPRASPPRPSTRFLSRCAILLHRVPNPSARGVGRAWCEPPAAPGCRENFVAGLGPSTGFAEALLWPARFGVNRLHGTSRRLNGETLKATAWDFCQQGCQETRAEQRLDRLAKAMLLKEPLSVLRKTLLCMGLQGWGFHPALQALMGLAGYSVTEPSSHTNNRKRSVARWNTPSGGLCHQERPFRLAQFCPGSTRWYEVGATLVHPRERWHIPPPN